MSNKEREQSIYQRYIAINSRIKQLEGKKREIGQECLEDMKEKKANQVKFDVGTFSLVERKKWKYSGKVEKAEDLLWKLKRGEQKTGVAKAEISQNLRFQEKINEDNPVINKPKKKTPVAKESEKDLSNIPF